MSKIEDIIKKQFEKHRILFWYDPQQEFRDDYWALQLPAGREKIEVVHDEFGVKHRMLVLQPEAKFLPTLPMRSPAIRITGCWTCSYLRECCI